MIGFWSYLAVSREVRSELDGAFCMNWRCHMCVRHGKRLRVVKI